MQLEQGTYPWGLRAEGAAEQPGAPAGPGWRRRGEGEGHRDSAQAGRVAGRSAGRKQRSPIRGRLCTLQKALSSTSSTAVLRGKPSISRPGGLLPEMECAWQGCCWRRTWASDLLSPPKPAWAIVIFFFQFSPFCLYVHCDDLNITLLTPFSVCLQDDVTSSVSAGNNRRQLFPESSGLCAWV